MSEAPKPPITLSIELTPGLEYRGGRLDKLELHEPFAIHVQHAEQQLAQAGAVSNRNYQLVLVAKTTGIEEDALLQLPIGVFMRAARHLQRFVNSGLEGMGEQAGEDDEGGGVEATTDTLVLPLETPIKLKGIAYDEVSLTEPTLEGMRKAETALKTMQPHEVRNYQILLVHHASGLPLGVVHMLPVSVLNRAATFVQGFTLAGRETGKS